MDPNDVSKDRDERKRLKREYGDMFERMAALFFRFDPISINYETNTDEYEPEVSTILPRLKACGSADDVRAVLYEEFCHWFSPEDAGSPDRYGALSVELWTLWPGTIGRAGQQELKSLPTLRRPRG